MRKSPPGAEVIAITAAVRDTRVRIAPPMALPPAAEDSIALAFAERHSEELRYVAAWARWLRFDGCRWHHDDTLHAFDRARAICREIAVSGDKPVSAIASAKTVAAVERLAKTDRRLAVSTEQWDHDFWMFNEGEHDDDG